MSGTVACGAELDADVCMRPAGHDGGHDPRIGGMDVSDDVAVVQALLQHADLTTREFYAVHALIVAATERPEWVDEGEMRWDMAEALGFEIEDDAPPWSWLMRSARATTAKTAPDADGDLLVAAEAALRTLAKKCLAVKPTLSTPFPDAPDVTPWGRFVEQPCREAYDLAVRIRRTLGALPQSPTALEAAGATEDALRDAVTDLLRRVGRMRDDWSESNAARQNELWRSVHTAAEHVGAVLDAENVQAWADELARLDRGSPLLPTTRLRKDTKRERRDSLD